MANILQVVLRLTGQNAGASTAIMQVHDALELADMAVGTLQQSIGQLVSAGFGMNATMETTTLQFRACGLSADAAQRHVKGLFGVAKATPFEAAPIIEASRNLRTFGGAALDTHDNLLLVGDAAAATSANIQEVAFWTGRAYSAIQAGRPFGDAAQRLQELGILSGTARNQLEDLQKSGASAAEQWRVLDADFRRFTGAMEAQAQTWKGLSSTMSDTIRLLAADTTHEAFVRLEADMQRVNKSLADPQAQANARAIGVALGVGVDIAVAGVEAGARQQMEPMTDVQRIIADYNGLVEHGGALTEAVVAHDMPRAFDILRESLVETRTDVDNVSDAFSRHADAARTASAAIEAAIPIHKQMRDTWEDEAYWTDQAAVAVGGYRDESYRAAAAQQILNQQLLAARMVAAEGAEDFFTRHPNLDMSVFTQGNLSGIDAIMKKQQDQQRAQERQARDAERAQEKAAGDAEKANRDAARGTETAWTEAHKAVTASAISEGQRQIMVAQTVADALWGARRERQKAAAEAAQRQFQATRDALQARYGSPSGGLLPFGGPERPLRNLPFVAPVYVDLRGSTQFGAADLNRQVTDAVNAGLRSGAVRVPGLATR